MPLDGAGVVCIVEMSDDLLAEIRDAVATGIGGGPLLRWCTAERTGALKPPLLKEGALTVGKSVAKGGVCGKSAVVLVGSGGVTNS